MQQIEDDQTREAVAHATVDGQEVGIEAYKITLCRILLPRSVSSMTSLRPTRWIFILSANLIHLQVGAEIQVAREEEREEEGSEEVETEVLESEDSPLAENKKIRSMLFHLPVSKSHWLHQLDFSPPRCICLAFLDCVF